MTYQPWQAESITRTYRLGEVSPTTDGSTNVTFNLVLTAKVDGQVVAQEPLVITAAARDVEDFLVKGKFENDDVLLFLFDAPKVKEDPQSDTDMDGQLVRYYANEFSAWVARGWRENVLATEWLG